MRDSGFVGRAIPGERLLYTVFNVVGETLPSMVLAREAATFARGRPRDAMRAAGTAAAGTLAAMIQPFAWPLINEHREAGRQLVMATTTPHDLVAPLAELARLRRRRRHPLRGRRRRQLRRHASSDPFVWAAGKLDAVRRGRTSNDVDLGESYAYSDSVFDTPLLSAVGHPVAVNPDPSMLVMATLRRWPVRHFDVAPGVRQDPRAGCRTATRRAAGGPTGVHALRALRHRRCRAHPRARPGDRRVQPPQLLRRRSPCR